jgi:hypothetical protein
MFFGSKPPFVKKEKSQNRILARCGDVYTHWLYCCWPLLLPCVRKLSVPISGRKSPAPPSMCQRLGRATIVTNSDKDGLSRMRASGHGACGQGDAMVRPWLKVMPGRRNELL